MGVPGFNVASSVILITRSAWRDACATASSRSF